jgi:hypothetical protein
MLQVSQDYDLEKTQWIEDLLVQHYYFQLQLIMYEVQICSPEEKITWFYIYKHVFHHYQSFLRSTSFRILHVSHFHSLLTKAYCSIITHHFTPISSKCSLPTCTFLLMILKKYKHLISAPHMRFTNKILRALLSSTTDVIWGMCFQSYLSWFNHPNNITRRLQIIMLIMQFSPFCYIPHTTLLKAVLFLSKIFSLCASLKVTDQASSEPHHRKDEVLKLYILTYSKNQSREAKSN